MLVTSPSRRSLKRNASRKSRLLEPLEVRSLLSAVIALSGNGTNIANNDTTPLLTDFTDFGGMSTAATATIGTVTRTFVIANSGDADLNLTGSPTLVSLSGDTIDFTLSTDATSSTIPAGGSASFTISFVPTAAGLDQAAVTVASDDPNTPAFTFDIQGTGLTTTDSPDGLQVGTTVTGTGSSAIVGSALAVNYTGYFTNGTIFDSSDPTINPGRTPFDLVLGRNSVIQGWEEGLLGIQAGETRYLIIPSDLAYGTGGFDNPSGVSIPPNTPLIFQVSAVSVDQPSIVVVGNGHSITSGDTSPLASDFTDFGPMSTAQTLGTVSRSFIIGNTSSADLRLTGIPLVAISGTDASDFSVSTNPTSLLPTGSDSITNFTVTFSPSAPGLRQATITIPNSDPDLPNFTFDIQGTGLNTTNSTDGLMIATTTAGSGTAATTGSQVSLTFTGTQFNGTIVGSATDSTAPASILIGDPTQLAGINEGLIGIQPGETRTIIMPGTLGIHDTTNSAANLPLIYTVTAESVNAPISAMQITGNGNPITAGATASSATNFTDFGLMSTTRSALIGLDTRTYTINNSGGLPLTLSGGIKSVIISGANKGDFSVLSSPAAFIDTFSSGSFTIAFQPQGAGVRNATVTIISNDPAAPSYSFAIQGTGVATSTISGGEQIATPIKGAGTKALAGASLTVNYTGTLLDGTVFDSSLASGRSPFTFNLASGQVITGWDQALLGAKPGESFLLVIPASLAYGNTGSGSVPPNAPLIFNISVISVTNPSIVVNASGNTQTLTAGENSPSTSNGTSFVTVAGSSAPITVTFVVSSSTTGLTVFPKSPAVDLRPRSSANFTVSNITTTGTTSSFTVTYSPTVQGTQSATIHIHSADSTHPDFSFKVSGTYTKFVDLDAVSIGNINYGFPGTVVSGSSAKYNVPVTVTNLGNTFIPLNTPKVSFDFYLHDLITGNDTLLGRQTSAGLDGLGKGRTRTLNFSVPIPGNVSTGSYSMKVIIDNNSASQNTSTTNDSALSSIAVDVTQGFNNLLGVLSSSTLPLTIAHGVAPTGSFKLVVENGGNLTLPAGQKVTIDLIARPTGGGSDFVLKSSDVFLGQLAPGQSTNVTINNFTTGILAGTYQLLATLTPTPALTESNTGDNTLLTTSTGGTFSLTVT